MAWAPSGKHLIAHERVGIEARFASEPARGPAHPPCAGTVDLVNRAAEAAFRTCFATSHAARAAFHDRIADEIKARPGAITGIGTQETCLPVARPQDDHGRTTGQLRLFAVHIRKGDCLDLRHDPDRPPAPRPGPAAWQTARFRTGFAG